ncbi:MAG: nucleotidyltransferase family protein [Thermodesulfobacteriota bacterium]
MRKREMMEVFAAHREELRAMGVTQLALFGSTAREEDREGSDVDILLDTESPSGFFHLISIKLRLEEILGTDRVDVVTREGVHPGLKENILSEAIDVI